MSRLVIKDLPESVELDRAAMTAIVGGARTGGGFFGAAVRATNTRAAAQTATQATLRVIDYPKGFTAVMQPVDSGATRIPAGSLLRG